MIKRKVTLKTIKEAAWEKIENNQNTEKIK